MNWLVYIYAVVSGHVLEGSLGYYLNPLVNVLLGVVLLKERLSRGAALRRAARRRGRRGARRRRRARASGSASRSPLSFALYGFLRKVAPVDSLEGLSVETALLAPLALGWILWLQPAGRGRLRPLRLGRPTCLLILGGAVTAIPLLLFTAAAKRLPYSTLGFLQYVAPSLQFLLAVLVFGEPLTTAHHRLLRRDLDARSPSSAFEACARAAPRARSPRRP